MPLTFRTVTSFVISILLLSFFQGKVLAASPSAIALVDQNFEMPVITGLLTPPQLVIPDNGLSSGPSTPSTGEKGYIFYGFSWQSAASQLLRSQVGDEITLSFPAERSRTFIVYNQFRVDAKGDDQASLADDPHTLLIYSMNSSVDQDRHVILAKEKITAEVSSR